jgi:hypothetical protein
MTRYGLVCLLATLAWSQAASPRPGGTQEKPSAPSSAVQGAATAPNQAPAAPTAAEVPPDAAVITIQGLCASATAEKARAADCKTVITRSQFEAMVDAIQPNMPRQVRRRFATSYANALVMSRRAEEMGLDKGPEFDERMRLQRIQVLSQELNKALQEKASQVSDQQIQDYYHANLDKFVQVDLDRIYVPKTQKRPVAGAASKDDDDDKKPGAAEVQTSTDDSGKTMQEEADKLRARAATGADFAKLQAEAFEVAGNKSNASNVSLGKMRQAALPPSHASVMQLKAGQVSPVIADQSGYFIYKVKSVDTLPLDEVKEEIRGTLRSQNMQEETRSLQASATSTLDEAYFGPELPPRAPSGGPGAGPGASLPAGKPSLAPPGPK